MLLRLVMLRLRLWLVMLRLWLWLLSLLLHRPGLHVIRLRVPNDFLYGYQHGSRPCAAREKL